MPTSRTRRPDAARPHPSVAILWFRHDLRVTDQRALRAALDAADRVLPVFVLDEEAMGPWTPGGAARWWLHGSLATLSATLEKRGAPLLLRRGSAAAILPALAAETGAGTVHAGLSHEPWLRAVDEKVAAALETDGRTLHHHRTTTLFDLEPIRSKTGTRYGVYAPFARACRALPAPDAPLDAPDRIPGLPHPPKGDELDDWALLPTRPDWAGGLRDAWTPGEAGAAKRLAEFMSDRLPGYKASRLLPGDPRGTSMLSPHLRWGELSSAQVWHAAATAAGGRKSAREGHETFESELLWHDFSAYLLRFNPDMPREPLRPAFAALRWRKDAAELHAWQRGRTGIPIVDAGMRQLWQTGWMHNRVRMIAASFLCKHLLMHWRDGEDWFWDTLCDADLAVNSTSWQWIAGSGIDSQPFFRVFNPVTQATAYDKDGSYVRQYVPELAALPDKWLHRPFEAPEAVLKAARITLGETYPHPLVGLKEGRDRALAAFRDDVRPAAAKASKTAKPARTAGRSAAKPARRRTSSPTRPTRSS